MKTRIIFITIISFFAINAFGQTVLLDGVDHYKTEHNFGPGQKHYINFYINQSFFIDAPEDEKSDVELGLGTSNFAFGARYKRRLAKAYSVGFDLSWNVANFKLNPQDLLDFQKYKFSSFDLEFYNRINFGRCGNYLGKFIDVGVYGSVIYGSRMVYSPENTDIMKVISSENYKIIAKGIDDLEPIQYGVKARFGVNRFVLSASYRLSNYFDADSDELFPRLMVGVQIGLHK